MGARKAVTLRNVAGIVTPRDQEKTANVTAYVTKTKIRAREAREIMEAMLIEAMVIEAMVMKAPKIPARTNPTIAKTCPVSGANIIRPSSQCAALLVEDTNIQDKAAWKVSGWCSIGLKALLRLTHSCNGNNFIEYKW